MQHKNTVEAAMTDTKKCLVSSALPFPPLSWWQAAVRYDSVLLDAQERYEKMSLRNRYYLAGPQGKQLMSIPLKNGRNQRLRVGEVTADSNTNWQTRHWRTIQSFYGRAPFFEFFAEEIQALFSENRKEIKLFDWCFSGIKLVSSLLNLNLKLECTENFRLSYSESFQDGRFGLGEMAFDTKSPIVYHQVFQDRVGFVPDCSVLDVLFCCGPQAKVLIGNNGS